VRRERGPGQAGLLPTACLGSLVVAADSGIVFVPVGASRGTPGGVSTFVRPFAISVMTADLKDDAAGEAFIGDVTRAVYDSMSAVARSTGYERRMD